MSKALHINEREHAVLPKTAFVAELAPGNRKLVEFSVELANNPGALAEVATVLSKHKVNVLTGFHDSEHWSFFADVTQINSSMDEIVKEISSLAPVRNVSIGQGLPEGIIVDTLHEQLMLGPSRAIIARADVMSSILDRLKGIFGVEGKAGKAIVHGMGGAAGRTFYKAIASQIGAETVKSRIKDVIGLYTAQGWGIFKLISVDFDRATAHVAAQNNFECAPFQGSGSSPRGEFVRGHFAGLFSEIFGKRMEVTETNCIARGDGDCKFEIHETGQ